MNKLKFVFVFLALLLCSFLFACNKEGGADSSKVFEEVHNWIEENYKEGVSSDIELPKTCPLYDGVTIDWYSDDAFLMDNDGHIVERGKKATGVDFTYYIRYKGESLEYTKHFVVTSITIERATERFEAQFPVRIFESVNWETTFDKAIKVTWESSNQDVFSNEGIYTKPDQDTTITITYTISDGNHSVTKTKELSVQGKTNLDFFEEAEDWISTKLINDTYLTENLNLPDNYNDKVEIVWTSSDTDVIDEKGNITKTLYERYAELTAKLSIGSSLSTYTFNITVEAKDISSMTEEEILEEFIRIITVPSVGRVYFGGYANISQYYSFIHFYEKGTVEKIQKTLPVGGNRPGIVKKTEYIVVHDTANNNAGADALANTNYALNQGPELEVSWHFTVGEEATYQLMPTDEVAYHAGDGSRTFALEDTGIKATARKPIITLDEQGYFAINGQSTTLRPYTDRAGTTKDMRIFDNSDFGQMGILCEIGENGNYFLGKTYYNSTYGYISNFGGNRNGVGIESCVNAGTDYGTTQRILAKLVGELCSEYDLSVDRVQPHHFFSGKPCAYALMTAHYWYNFKNLVALEKFALDHLQDYEFSWTSNSNLLDSMGRIKMSAKSGDKVSYSLVVTKNGTKVYQNSFETTVK